MCISGEKPSVCLLTPSKAESPMYWEAQNLLLATRPVVPCLLMIGFPVGSVMVNQLILMSCC